MKKTLLFIGLAIIVSLFTQNAQAKIWRVNNTSNYKAGTTLYGDNLGGTSINPVFAQLSDANNSNLVDVNGIDTLHVEGTNIQYNGVAFTMKVIVIGTGYFLNENPNVSNTVSEASVSDVSFSSNSEGSQLIGVHVFSGFGITINVSNILIKRCRIDYSIAVNSNISDVFVLQNYFTNTANSNASAITCNGFGFATNFIFDNNICKKTLLLSTSATNIYNAEECNNNVFDCPAISGGPSIQMNTTSFKNNILKTSAATVNINGNVVSDDVSFNTSASATNQFGTTNHNIVITDMSTLFVDPSTNTTDGRYQLKPGSAAGADSTDRGAFGGLAVSNHYMLSGLAAIPVIYNIATSGVGTSGINVSIKARTIK